MDGAEAKVGSNDREEVIPYITEQLCLAIDTTCKQSLQEADPLVEKRLRSGRFLCSLLLRLLSEFPVCVSACVRVLHQLLLSTHANVHSVDNTSLQKKLESAFLLLVRMQGRLAYVHA